MSGNDNNSHLLASMSHEIRTPMNTIIGLLDIFRTDNLDTEQASYVEVMKHMSSVLLQIINDILDFQTIESGNFEVLPSHFNLRAFYENMVSRHQFLAESKQLEFKSGFAQGLPHSVYGDEKRIDQIITNLLSNAIKYTRKGFVDFRVDSAVENGKEYIAFTVEDSGAGIKEEDLPHLFDDDTGSGLSAVKRLATQMEGHILFKSKYGAGSSFTFSLPLILSDPENKVATDTKEYVKAVPGTTVLVVDDDAGSLKIMTSFLARHGITPRTAANGLEAIEMVKADKYDLVFMDHRMPKMDGAKATAAIRALGGKYFSNVPVITLSANVGSSARKLFVESGMNDFIPKPIDSNELNRVLMHWLPKDKIAPHDHETEAFEAPPVDEAALNKLLEELLQIQDLSILKGLALMDGDKKLYIDVLWQFYTNAAEDVNELKRYVKEGQWQYYAITVHALRSVFANIGNQFMSDWASNLEKAAQSGDIHKCVDETNGFCNALMQFHFKLQQTALMDKMESEARKIQIKSDDLKLELEQLLFACHDLQSDTAEMIVDELLKTTYNPNVDASLEKLTLLVQTFDYDEAIVVIEDLIRSL